MKTNAESAATRLTWCPPVGEGFIVSPLLAELETAVLHQGSEFWNAGSCDGGLFFDVAGHATTDLKLMFAAPDRFCVQHTNCLTGTELVASVLAVSPETVCVCPGGNPWRLPRHYFVDRNTAWRAVQSFYQDGRCGSEIPWVPFEPPDLDS